MQDTKTVLEFVEARDPFSDYSSFRSVVTGVIADNRLNVDKAKKVGQNYIWKIMTHKNTEEYTRQTSYNSGHIHDFWSNKRNTHRFTTVLLFHRLIAIRNCANEDIDVLFKHELRAVPASLFESNGLPRKANKPVLREAIWKVIDANV